MDDNTRQVLVALIAGLSGLLTGTLVAKIGFAHGRDVERDRRGYEQQRQWMSDRRQAYARLITEFDRHHHRVLSRLDDPLANVTEEPTEGQLGSADAPYEDILIIGARPVRHAASDLYGALIILDVYTRIRPMDGVILEAALEKREELMGLWLALRSAVHADLGVEPDTPEEIAEWLRH